MYLIQVVAKIFYKIVHTTPPTSLSTPYFLLKKASTFPISRSSSPFARSSPTTTYCGQSITVTPSSLTNTLYSLRSPCTTPFTYANPTCSKIQFRYHSGSACLRWIYLECTPEHTSFSYIPITIINPSRIIQYRLP